MKKRSWQELPIDRVQEGPTCREPDEDQGDDVQTLDKLCLSVQAHGLMHPIRVRQMEENLYRCTTGIRRLRAARLAGLKVVPCEIVAGDPTKADILEEQLVENLQRVNLRRQELGTVFRELMETHKWSQRQLAERLCINQGTVSRALALMDLAGPVRELVETGSLPASTALVLKHDAPADQVEKARELVKAGATREQAQRRQRPQPKSFDLTTPGGWAVVATAKRSKATRAELLGELAGLVEELRGEQPGPRLAA
jgi:ParB/RepB/Spo0J family partition protein